VGSIPTRATISNTMKTIILDPGHGMSNRKRGVYDPGAVSNGIAEATIAMDWANELRTILQSRKFRVIRTRIDAKDPAPVSRRDDIAVSYGGDVMLSLHCNATTGSASGTEVFYRGSDDKAMAAKLSAAVSTALGTKNRGAKTEAQSQHSALAVMEFDKCWLIELGFIDNPGDRAKMLDPTLRRKACEAIANAIS
jgi:N-acetylmuramoyl-L-alanine amidase